MENTSSKVGFINTHSFGIDSFKTYLICIILDKKWKSSNCLFILNIEKGGNDFEKPFYFS